MAENKNQPKPFLKRGTGKLSNAMVRSQAHKPKIVEYGNENDGMFQKPKQEAEEEIKIEIKVKERPKASKQINLESSKDKNQEFKKAKQNKNINEMKPTSSKKGSAALEDYICVSNNKKQSIRNNQSKEKYPPVPAKILNNQKITTMTGMLKRLDADLPSSEDQKEELHEEHFNTFGSKVNQMSRNNAKSLSKEKNVVAHSNMIDKEGQIVEKIQFNSDSEDQRHKETKAKVEEKKVQNSFKSKGGNKWEDEEQSSVPTTSKIMQKYYKKQVQVQPKEIPKKLTISDLPRQLIEQIINNFVADKGVQVQKKLSELQNAISKRKKEQEKYEEENKKLQKQRELFEKEMEEKTRQFEEKLKNENSKLNRQKKYLKNQQTSDKGDWKIKNELEELKKKCDQLENEKKKIKNESSREIERLRKKLEEENSEKQSLLAQIKCYELQKLTQNKQIKEKNKQIESVQKNNEKNNYWQGAPTRSYVLNFFDDNFSLISFDARYYSFENLEYYIYYLSKKDEVSQLISEQKDTNGAKIVRKYKNGKQQHEYISKLIKEVFPPPFKFTIIHHLTGDIKLITPEGIHIYFDNRNQITQWKITPQKMIHNFHQSGQIQLKKFKMSNLQIHQIYKNNLLKRKTKEGQENFKRVGNSIQSI